MKPDDEVPVPSNIQEEITRIQEKIKTASKKEQTELISRLKSLKKELTRMNIKGLLRNAIGDYNEAGEKPSE